MGTWGPGPFDNDSAADFACDVQDCKGVSERQALLRQALCEGIVAAAGTVLSNEFAWGYELEFAVAAAAYVADEHTGDRRFTDNAMARGLSEGEDELLPFVELAPLPPELLEEARRFIFSMLTCMRRNCIDAVWVEPVQEIREALMKGAVA